MNRLTDRNKEMPTPISEHAAYYARCVNKLADYEDTGLEPEEVRAIQALTESHAYQAATLIQGACEPWEKVVEIARAQADGRLIVLPCKCGDTLCYIFDGKIYEGTVYHIQYDDYHGAVRTTVSSSLPGGYSCAGAGFDDFGKTGFLSREEAEAALGGDGDG